METNINEISTNPRNPRMITEGNRVNLLGSILFFDKMLQIREIVTNQAGMILGGNMRYSALLAISKFDPMALQFCLETYREYNEMSEADQLSLVSHWTEWIANPIITVQQVSLSKDEEDEMVLKDNIGFGKFEMHILSTIYDDDRLREFGFQPEELPSYEENKVYIKGQVKGSNAAKIEWVIIGNLNVPLSFDEFQLLLKQYEIYKKEAGTSYGFLTKLINQWKQLKLA